MNTVVAHDEYSIDNTTQSLHQSLAIADLHADSLLWKRDLTRFSKTGHVDLPRLQKGNVALQVFTAVTKSPANQNYEIRKVMGENAIQFFLKYLPRRPHSSS